MQIGEGVSEAAYLKNAFRRHSHNTACLHCYHLFSWRYVTLAQFSSPVKEEPFAGWNYEARSCLAGLGSL